MPLAKTEAGLFSGTFNPPRYRGYIGVMVMDPFIVGHCTGRYELGVSAIGNRVCHSRYAWGWLYTTKLFLITELVFS